MRANVIIIKKFNLVLGFLLILFIGGCISPEGITPQTTLSPSTPAFTSNETQEILTTTIAPFPTSQPPDPLSKGPFLLIQTNYETYKILDISQNKSFLFTPPINEQISLEKNLSPSHRYMFFQVKPDTLVIKDFVTWQSNTINHLFGKADTLQPEKTAEVALETLPELGFTLKTIVLAIEGARDQSKQNIQWTTNDRHLLSVQEDSQTGTHLYLNDLQTNSHNQLENMPGLVQDYWVSPDGAYILLKKGIVFEPNIWQDDRYYLVNISEQSAELLALPEGINQPSLFWLGSHHIGLTHQTQLKGGVGFSVIAITPMEITPIFDSAFNQIYQDGENFFVVIQDPTTKTSLVTRMDFKGQITQEQTLEGLCQINQIINDKVILNCETESIILDDNFNTQPLGDPIFILTPAPDAQNNLLITRTNAVVFLNADLDVRQSLVLNGIPLEIRWLPDSSGFLYRTLGELHYYHLDTEESFLLMEADLFGDYRNLNAVWLNRSEEDSD